MYVPYFKLINDWIHKNTKWKTLKHSCGAILPLLPSIIDAGFDIINPVQFSATDMDTKTLKKEFGKDIVFWGGGVDTQTTLTFGTIDEIKEEVEKMMKIFSTGGGFVFTQVHNIQGNITPEKIMAVYETAKKFRKY